MSAAGIAIAFAALTFTTKRREASAPVAAIARSESTSVAAPPIPPAAIATLGDSNTASLLFTRIDHSLDQLVDVTNMRLFREWQDPPETYLGPGVNDVEGTATYNIENLAGRQRRSGTRSRAARHASAARPVCA